MAYKDKEILRGASDYLHLLKRSTSQRSCPVLMDEVRGEPRDESELKLCGEEHWLASALEFILLDPSHKHEIGP